MKSAIINMGVILLLLNLSDQIRATMLQAEHSMSMLHVLYAREKVNCLISIPSFTVRSSFDRPR